MVGQPKEMQISEKWIKKFGNNWSNNCHQNKHLATKFMEKVLEK